MALDAIIRRTQELTEDRVHKYDNYHYSYYRDYINFLLSENGKSESELLQDTMFANLILYHQMKAEFYIRKVYDSGDLHLEDYIPIYKVYEHEYDTHQKFLDSYKSHFVKEEFWSSISYETIQPEKNELRRSNRRKLNTLVNNFFHDVIGKYEVEKPECCYLIPLFDKDDRDVRSYSCMRFVHNYNYAFAMLPYSAGNNPKEYMRELIHEIFHYTPFKYESERITFLFEMLSASILRDWKIVLKKKVKNGEISQEESESAYKNALEQVRKFMSEKARLLVENYGYKEHDKDCFAVHPTLLNMLSLSWIHLKEADELFEIIKSANTKIGYSEAEKSQSIGGLEFYREKHFITLNNFLSEVYSDIYMAVLCDVTAKEYIKMLAINFDFAKIKTILSGDDSILRFGFMAKTLFNCTNWREKTLNVLSELDSEGVDKECIKNLKEYLEVYDKIVGTEENNYFETAINSFVEKWICDAKEIKENCHQSLSNLLNFENVEYRGIRMLEKLNNDMQLSDPYLSDIRYVRAIDRARLNLILWGPHEVYAETCMKEGRTYHKIFENSFSVQLKQFDVNYGRCDFRINVCGE